MYAGLRLSAGDSWEGSAGIATIPNRTGEIPPSGMKWGDDGNVGIIRSPVRAIVLPYLARAAPVRRRRLQTDPCGARGTEVPRPVQRRGGGPAPPHRSRAAGAASDGRECRGVARRRRVPDQGRDRALAGAALPALGAAGAGAAPPTPR